MITKEFTPHPIRLAIFHSVPAWRRFRSLHQVPDLPGEFILTRNRVIQAARDSRFIKELASMGIYLDTPESVKELVRVRAEHFKKEPKP